jgi:hypothetical protein
MNYGLLYVTLSSMGSLSLVTVLTKTTVKHLKGEKRGSIVKANKH